MPIIILLLVLLWFFGYIQIPWFTIPRFPLFTFNGQVITFYDAIILILAVWAISFLPGILRVIAGILLFMWLFSVLNISIFGGLSQWIMLALIFAIAWPLIRT